jgi:hypothetical protein
MFGFCVLKERKETCTVLRLISSSRTYTLTNSRPPSANPVPSPAASHKTATRAGSSFDRQLTELREHHRVETPQSRRDARSQPTRTCTPPQPLMMERLFDRNKRVTPQKPLIMSGFPLRPYKMGSFRIGPYWLCLAFFSFDRHSPPPGIGFVRHRAVEQPPRPSYAEVLAPMP